MKKCGTILTAILLIIVSCFGCVLPFILSPEKQTQIQHVPLDMPQYFEEDNPLSVGEKLYLLRYGGQCVFVRENMMQSTRRQILDSLYDSIGAFWKEGIFRKVSPCVNLVVKPCIIFETEQGKASAYFWLINLMLDDGTSQISLTCYVDDENRSLYQFNAGSHNSPLIEGNVEDGMETFIKSYFKNLGIEDAKLYYESPTERVYKVPIETDKWVLVEILYVNAASGEAISINSYPFEETQD